MLIVLPCQDRSRNFHILLLTQALAVYGPNLEGTRVRTREFPVWLEALEEHRALGDSFQEVC